MFATSIFILIMFATWFYCIKTISRCWCTLICCKKLSPKCIQKAFICTWLRWKLSIGTKWIRNSNFSGWVAMSFRRAWDSRMRWKKIYINSFDVVFFISKWNFHFKALGHTSIQKQIHEMQKRMRKNASKNEFEEKFSSATAATRGGKRNEKKTQNNNNNNRNLCVGYMCCWSDSNIWHLYSAHNAVTMFKWLLN